MFYLETLLSSRWFGVSHTAEGINFLAESGDDDGTANFSNRSGDFMFFVGEIVTGERDSDAQKDNEQALHDVPAEEDSLDCPSLMQVGNLRT